MLTVAILPNISVNYSYFTFLVLGASLALINAVVKPALQLLTLPLIFVSYGVVLIAVNAVMLLILQWLFPERFVIEGLVIAFIAGGVVGVLVIILENLFGLTPPIVDDQVAKTAGGD